MERFPAEFSDLVDGRRLNRAAQQSSLKVDCSRLRWFPHFLRREIVSSSVELLDRWIAPHLTRVQVPIPAEALQTMRKSYAESLPKTVRNATVLFGDRSSTVFREACGIGLMEMMESKSLHELAERVSGYRLERYPSIQGICYATGDYVGPHNDHHPDNDQLRGGYLDLQLTLSNAAVRRQVFVHESDGYLNNTLDVGVDSGLAFLFLPFWHQIMPLEAKMGREATARRWVILASFVLSQSGPRVQMAFDQFLRASS